MRLPTLQELAVIGLIAAAAFAVVVFVCAMIDHERTARALGVVKIALTSFMKPFRRRHEEEERRDSDEPASAARRPAVKAPPTISDFARPPLPRERVERDG